MSISLIAQEDQVSVEVPIDPRVHRRLIGAKGRAIRKFMETYRVDIRFPSLNTSDPVVISGHEENVEEARDQLLLLEEEYVSTVISFSEGVFVTISFAIQHCGRTFLHATVCLPTRFSVRLVL